MSILTKKKSAGKAIEHDGFLNGRLKEQLVLQSMVIPGIVYLFIFAYIPLFGIVIAFQNYDLYSGVMGSQWVGFKHFAEFFSSESFGVLMRNTLCISFLKLIFGFPAPIILAILFNIITSSKIKKGFQTITYLPHFISWVIVVGMFTEMLSVDDGTINTILCSLGIIKEPINFLSEPKYFWAILIISSLWKNVGYGAIIYLAAISGINAELYEAASVEGASKFRQIFVITLPCIVPQIVIKLIMDVSRILNAGFDDILLFTNNGDNAILLQVGDVIDTYVYRFGVKMQRFSYSTAVGLFKSVVNIAMLFIANGISKKLSDSSLW